MSPLALTGWILLGLLGLAVLALVLFIAAAFIVAYLSTVANHLDLDGEN